MAANRDSYDRRNARGDYPSDGAGSYARRSGGLSQKEKGKIVNVGAWGLLALILLLGVILAIGVLVHNCSGSGQGHVRQSVRDGCRCAEGRTGAVQ